jgi:ubiquinone/menaquinone biosynthesis C-methylase UbiE
MNKNNDWEVWNKNEEYGDVFYRRAIGKLPEMESSKAAANQIDKIISENDLIIDVGCGAGHYLRSLVNKLKNPFNYVGVDATSYYVEMAKKAWEYEVSKKLNLSSANFIQGDIFNIPLDDKTASIVMCNNVLLHLPSIEKPISELIRVSSKYVVIRMLLGNNSFRIMQSYEPETYDSQGNPRNFNFHNIYSERYISKLLDENKEIESYEFIFDNDFDPDNINNSAKDYIKEPTNATKVINKMQVNNYIIQPWQFVIIKKK